jgi:hypothetical protein
MFFLVTGAAAVVGVEAGPAGAPVLHRASTEQ